MLVKYPLIAPTLMMCSSSSVNSPRFCIISSASRMTSGISSAVRSASSGISDSARCVSVPRSAAVIRFSSMKAGRRGSSDSSSGVPFSSTACFVSASSSTSESGSASACFFTSADTDVFSGRMSV